MGSTVLDLTLQQELYAHVAVLEHITIVNDTSRVVNYAPRVKPQFGASL